MKKRLYSLFMCMSFFIFTPVYAVPVKTVVIRVVGTNSSWGQEAMPGWVRASPIKSTRGYSVYDLEIARTDASSPELWQPPTYAALYKFPDWSDANPFMSNDEALHYKTSSTLKKITFKQYTGSSADYYRSSTAVSAALKALVNQVLIREKGLTRLVLFYSGHGSPHVFFEGVISNPDSEDFVKTLRKKLGKKTFILDFSTNCDVGFFDFAVRYYRFADYLIASDKPVGGYSPNVTNGEGYFTMDHDGNLAEFWKNTHNLEQAFDVIMATRKNRWDAVSDSLRDSANPQSLSVYKLAEFETLLTTLKANGLNPAVDLPTASNDLATYAYASGNADLIAAMNKFRIRYASDRNYVTWSDDSQGFSVDNITSLESYLNQ